MKINKQQIIIIHTLLHKESLLDQKPEIVASFSSENSGSTKSLSFDEANQLIKHLGGYPVRDTEAAENKKFGWLSQNNSQHAKIVSILKQLGWRWEQNPNLVDVARLGRWIRGYGKHKKPLSGMTTGEVSDTINQLENILYKTCI